MRRGPKPKPTAIRLLDGGGGHRPLNHHEPQHPALDPAPPEQLTDPIAIAEWQRVIGALAHGHVTIVDRAVLIGYCQKWAQWLQIEEEAARHPFIVKGAKGLPMPNPALSLANRTYVVLLRTAAELGITPSSRSRIIAAPGALPAGGTDEFTAFQRRRRQRP